MSDQNNNDNFDLINQLNSKINSKLNKTSEDDELEQLEDKINSFKPYLTGGKNSNNNNIVEFMTKLLFDKNNKNLKNATTIVDKQKAIQDMISKEKWGRLFDQELERINGYGEYEIIYKAIPELAACIDSYRDAIISPDSLINDELPIKLDETKVSKEALDTFENNIEALNKKYNIKQLQKQIIGDTLKLGDQFYHIVRYEDEFKRMLLSEDQSVSLPPEFFNPKLRKNDDIPLNESFYQQPIFDELKTTIFNERGITDISKVDNKTNIEVNDYYDKVVDNIKNIINDIKIKDSSELVNENKRKIMNSKRIEFDKLDLKGCMIKKLDPTLIVKLEIDGINLGYLYAIKKTSGTFARAQDTLMKDFFTTRSNLVQDIGMKSKDELIFNILSKGIAKKLDLDFIEENKEYKNLIYLLLKNQELTKGEIEFLYLNPDEVKHFYVDKEQVYGTSRMANSLFLAKIYISSLLNELMEKLTRGRDKRVVYVDVGVDEAAEEAIQEVIRDFKSKEIQTDSLQSLTTILRTVGNFEDYYIPTWDGEKSIELDTIQGMDTMSDQDWLNNLLKSVIKGTGFPSNYIDASNDVDFARTVIMQNQLLVRKIVSDQETFSELMTDFVSTIYKYEYEKNNSTNDKEKTNELDQEEKEQQSITEEILNNMEVKYNPPVTLNLSNINEQISNATQTMDFIMGSYFDDQQEETAKSKLVKLKFKRKIAERLMPSINFDEYDDLLLNAKLEADSELLLKKTITNEDEFADEYGYGDDLGQGGMDFGADQNMGGGMDFNQQPVDQTQTQNQDLNNQDLNNGFMPTGNEPKNPDSGQPMNGVEDLQNGQTGL